MRSADNAGGAEKRSQAAGLQKGASAAITTALPSTSPRESGVPPGKDSLEKKGRSGVFLPPFYAHSIHPVSRWGIMPSKGARISTRSVGHELDRERKHTPGTSPGQGDEARKPWCGAEGGGPPLQRREMAGRGASRRCRVLPVLPGQQLPE